MNRRHSLLAVLRVTDRRARLLFAVLATVGCTVGFLRVAFPARAHAVAMRTVSDDSTPDDTPTTVDNARPARSGMRRAATTLGPSLPKTAAHVDAGRDSRLLDIGRRVIAPGSFIPNPPFHPPRSA